MKEILRKEKGVTMVALVITVIILLILSSVLIYNAQDSIHIKALNNLYNDIELLREKVSSYYNEYGNIPAKIKYTNIEEMTNIFNESEKKSDFYVIDLEAMKGISLNYGKEYETIKNDSENANNYTDIYIINEYSQNVFYVKGISIRENDEIKTYYTDYIEPDETTIDLRYIDGILIPEEYYYIGKVDEKIVISSIKNEEINDTSENQYIWETNISIVDKIPDSIELSEEQNEAEFLKSVNYYDGYFKNKNKTENIDIIYISTQEEKWSQIYTKDIEYKDENGDTAYIPQGFSVSMSPLMNTINRGLVIKDNSGNEYVWIGVPKKITESCLNDKQIEEALIKYASDYREDQYEDVWHEGCGLEEDEYNNLKSKMLRSIRKNGGFWISRYEIGDSTATGSSTTRTSDSGTTGIAVSKIDQIPYNWITCSQAQDLASKMLPNEDDNNTSSLLFGIQCNLIFKFLEENSSLTYEEIVNDSVEWGNFKNSSLTLNRGKYNINPSSASSSWVEYDEDTPNYVSSSKTSSDENYYQLLTTGASEDTNKLNIYDLAGNEWEWTLAHHYQNSDYPCSVFGGGYDNGSDIGSSTIIGRVIEQGMFSYGFRVSIF